jgi:hypothetical protein
MRKSVRRYLLAGGFLALLVNLAINAGAGVAIYGDLAAVPLAGDHGIAGDTIVGAFLIAFFTLVIVAPATRREVRAGHVVGGRRFRVPAWFAKRPVVTAIAGGVVSAVVVGGGAVAIVAALDVAPMSLHAFLWFKVLFAGAWGSLAAVVVGALAIAGEPEPPDDDRWCRDPAVPALVYPFDYVDKGGVAVTSKLHGCSGTPTWQLVTRGAPDPAAVRAALGDLLVRYPSLTTRVQALDAIPEYAKVFRYAGAPVELDSVFEVVDLRGRQPELEPLIRDVWNRHLDQFREPPFSLAMALTDTGCRLLFRQHHGIADGRAFIELLGDFGRYIAAREAGRAPDDLAPIGRRGELEPLGLSGPARIWYGIAGLGSLIASVVRALVRPLAVLVQNESTDYTGWNGAIRWVIEDSALEGWRPAREQLGASLTSILTGALFLANQRWHRALGRELGRVSCSLVMETRPRDGSFRSFANHLATLEAELPLERDLDPAEMVRSIHVQVRRQLARKRPQKRLVCERALVLGMPLDKLQQFVFATKRPAFNINVSNLIPLPFPVLAGASWTVDEVLITTPVTPRNGIVLTVIRYNGRLCFNFNHAQSAVTAEQTAHLARLFTEALREITGYLPTELPTAAHSAPE